MKYGIVRLLLFLFGGMNMFTIYKVTANNVVDFAAEELKKYVRMMMPKCGEIDIRFDPSARRASE
jgi:hypothetical protein